MDIFGRCLISAGHLDTPAIDFVFFSSVSSSPACHSLQLQRYMKQLVPSTGRLGELSASNVDLEGVMEQPGLCQPTVPLFPP